MNGPAVTKSSLEWLDIDEARASSIADRLARNLNDGVVVYLYGNLGAGKTSFARALLRALGVGERVKSPTYSLIESYSLGPRSIHHLDLYRIADAEELEWLGLQDFADAQALFLIEWPDRGAGCLPVADIEVRLAHAAHGRDLQLLAKTDRGLGYLMTLNLPEAGVTNLIEPAS